MQLVLVFFSPFQYLAFPFAMLHDAVDLSLAKDTWLGEPPTDDIWTFLDAYCLLIFGAAPWQVNLDSKLTMKTDNEIIVT